MATVFMRWLENTPADYERGIQLLTLGRLNSIHERIARECASVGDLPVRVLEIGCGTGRLSVMMAKQGAQVTAIDVSPAMLEVAKNNALQAGLQDAITFTQLDVTEIAKYFEPESFDLIVSTLAFSEFHPEVVRFALQEALRLLTPSGSLLIADEVLPQRRFSRLLYWAVRLPLVILTWILTRTTTVPLEDFASKLQEAGFVPRTQMSLLGGSLQLIEARPQSQPAEIQPQWTAYPQLSSRLTLKRLLLDAWSYFFRLFPPYAKTPTGLYRIGRPQRESPVLVTGNYHLTVRRLVDQLDGRLDCWLVVANSRGINVWCSAGGGHFTAEDVISAINTSGVKDAVDHHALILPQLCANGVDGWKIRHETGWGVHWGPARASDIPAYLSAGRKKTDQMRHVAFPLADRLEMTTVMLLFYGIFMLVLGLIFWRSYLWRILAITAVLSYVYGLFLPWLPGRDGLMKGATLSILVLLGLWVWAAVWGRLAPSHVFNWSLGLGFLAFFIGAEFQGMSPLMRGEQANWTIEGIVGLVVLVAYAAGRMVFGG
jgi:ubiquinone/menaquinone biosynthesis C-methylase UbiE